MSAAEIGHSRGTEEFHGVEEAPRAHVVPPEDGDTHWGWWERDSTRGDATDGEGGTEEPGPGTSVEDLGLGYGRVTVGTTDEEHAT